MNRAATADGTARREHFPHDVDVGVRGFGETPAKAFEQAALALMAVVTQVEIEPKTQVAVTCEAFDLELLFVEWRHAGATAAGLAYGSLAPPRACRGLLAEEFKLLRQKKTCPIKAPVQLRPLNR